MSIKGKTIESQCVYPLTNGLHEGLEVLVRLQLVFPGEIHQQLQKHISIIIQSHTDSSDTI